MTSAGPHLRTQSSSSTVSIPRAYEATYSPHARTPSPKDTAYNGSEGHINGVALLRDLELGDTQLAAPPKAARPTRPAFGTRLLSSLSNAQPAMSTLTRKGSVLHSHTQSLASFVTKSNTSNASTPEKPRAGNKVFGDLFHGESAPVRLGAPVSPTKEKEEIEFVMGYQPTLTERPSGLANRRNTAQSQTSVVTPTKPTSWFSRRSTNPVPSKPQPQDEFASLPINASLFPNGPPDPLNPASFNDLLLNATTLLGRMQAAYKEKLEFIASMQPEMDAQREEMEEAETRSKHLKMQLEDMGRQAQEQETAMREIARQLAEEKIKVQEAREAGRTIRLVESPIDESPNGADEDTPRARKRSSADNASDSGFESDLDTESVFSASGGGSANTPLSPPSTSQSNEHKNDAYAWNLRQIHRRDVLQRRTSASTSSSTDPGARRLLGGERTAWATANALREENRELRKRVEEMQVTLQGCIDFVSSVHRV